MDVFALRIFISDERHNFTDARQGVKVGARGMVAGVGNEPDDPHAFTKGASMTIAAAATAANQTLPSPDFEAIKRRQQATWATGDFGRIGVQLQIVGESLCEAVDLRSRDRVLDVAAGNGNASLAAARRYAEVISTDFVPDLLQQGQRRAEAEGLPMTTQVADVENLPFADGSFDVVLSTYGVMFAPDQKRAAAEMLRVLRPGGRIGLANWTPDGYVGELFRLIGRFVPPPAGLAPPAAWGTETRVVELFGPKASDIKTQRKTFVFRYRSAEHWIEVFRTYYGPVNKAFAALDAVKQRELHEAMLALIARFNRSGDDALILPADYLEVVVTKALTA